MKTENFKFTSKDTISLNGRLYYNEGEKSRGIIFSHGLFSSKEGNKIVNLAGPIVEAGYTLMSFDFRFSAESGGNISEILIKDELTDLLSAVDYMKGLGIDEIHLMGSSLGGLISILAAAELKKNIKSIILIATPVKLVDLPGDITAQDIEELDPMGYRSYKGVLLNNGFFRELIDIDVKSNLEKIECPALVIHGGDDSVVDISNYYYIEENIRSPFTGVIIEGGDHRLYSENDFTILRHEIINWLKK